MNDFQAIVNKEMFLQLEEKDAEIERLNIEIRSLKQQILHTPVFLPDHLKLIRELADALGIVTQLLLVSELPTGIVSNKIRENHMFQQRAREALQRLSD